MAISAVAAPRSSSRAFVPTVIPCAKASIDEGSAPARASAASTAASTPSDWSSGVVGAFAVCRSLAVEDHGVGERSPHVDAEQHARKLSRGAGTKKRVPATWPGPSVLTRPCWTGRTRSDERADGSSLVQLDPLDPMLRGLGALEGLLEMLV